MTRFHSFSSPVSLGTLFLILLLSSCHVAMPTFRMSSATSQNTYVQSKPHSTSQLFAEQKSPQAFHQFNPHDSDSSGPLFNPHSPQRQAIGFSGDECSAGGPPCVPPRICIDPNVSPRDVCSRFSQECFCGYKNDEEAFCDCEKPCPGGERCVETLSGKNLCISRDVEGKDLECEDAVTPGRRFNFEKCRKQEDCAESHSCIQFLQDGDVPCEGGDDCICYTDDRRDFICSCRFPECPEGEKCSLRDGGMYCVSVALNDPDIACDSLEPLPPQSSTGVRYTGEECRVNEECAGERSCMRIADIGLAPCDGEKDCSCFPHEREREVCTCKNPECLPGDMCSFFPYTVACMSIAIGPHPLICNNSMIPESPLPLPSRDGKATFELCKQDNECAGNRECLDYQFKSCTGSNVCTCQPRNERFRSCSCEDQECLGGDICGFDKIDLYCISHNLEPHPNSCPPTKKPTTSATDAESTSLPDVTPDVIQDAASPEPIPAPASNVCVDAKALAHLDSNNLVFPQHPVSRVLCDQSGSCATPGHIVQYNGRAMMMSTYCEGFGCVERMMEVNSPRYQRGMRVGSKTEGLEYTVFAARYGTRGEEAVLVAAVRVGL